MGSLMIIFDYIGTLLCYNLVGKNVNLGTFHIIGLYFFISVLTPDMLKTQRPSYHPLN